MELHRDRCPRCGERLEHIRIKKAWADQCPVCEGVWLDREVSCMLTHKKEQVLTDIFRYILLDQCMGEIPTDQGFPLSPPKPAGPWGRHYYHGPGNRHEAPV